jgi:hypothetical protein
MEITMEHFEIQEQCLISLETDAYTNNNTFVYHFEDDVDNLNISNDTKNMLKNAHKDAIIMIYAPKFQEATDLMNKFSEESVQKIKNCEGDLEKIHQLETEITEILKSLPSLNPNWSDEQALDKIISKLK